MKKYKSSADECSPASKPQQLDFCLFTARTPAGVPLMPEQACQQSPRPTETEEGNAMLRSLLRSFTEARQLAVLIGSGCSLGLPVKSGPSMKDLWCGVKEKTGERFAKIREEVGDVEFDEKTGVSIDIERLMSRCNLYVELKGSTKAADVIAFVEDAEGRIRELVNFIGKGEEARVQLNSHEALLRTFVRRQPHQPRARVFTTNYDLCIETAASALQFIQIDGFSPSPPHVFDGLHFDLDYVRRVGGEDQPKYFDRVFQLYKLHGSLGWKRRNGEIRRYNNTKFGDMIYPANSKYERSYREPFLEMMSRFQSTLREPELALVVLGFGFNDAHLTGPILAAVRSNPGLRVLVIAPSLWKEDADNDALRQMRALIKAGDNRLTFASLNFSQLVRYLPDSFGETASTQHKKKIQRAMGLLRATLPNEGDD